MTSLAPTRLEQQLQRQRQMQQQHHNPYAVGPYEAGAQSLPPRQEQAQPDWTAAEKQQRHSANQ